MKKGTKTDKHAQQEKTEMSLSCTISNINFFKKCTTCSYKKVKYCIVCTLYANTKENVKKENEFETKNNNLFKLRYTFQQLHALLIIADDNLYKLPK